MIGSVLDFIGYFLLTVGGVFFFLGALGLFRMPDVYNRMQASTKTTTLGLVSFVIGVGFIEPLWLVKCFIIAMFILITSPIGASALARASYRSGVKLTDKTVIDECKGVKKW
ncbi:MAG: monovalent cation/H(+) antiporter subunit G [Thermoplasmata archaeon]|nr:monovalent cation/H(+) antiporter subunit G [Thermoplasmata archaeon]